MLASEDEDDLLAPLKYSLASDIVELVVLSADETFLATLREAMAGERRLWHVLSSDKVSDLLIAGEVGIVVLDLQALSESAGIFIDQIKRQFPDLVVIVAGNRDDENALAGLISAGIVYRFIHKPMSPGRAKLFAEAAIRKYGEQRRRIARTTAPVRPPLGGRSWLVGTAIAAALLLIGLAAFVVHENGSRAPPAAAAAADGKPAESSLLAKAAAAEERERLLARAENALLEERLDEAAAAIETARNSGVESGRIAFLSVQLGRLRDQNKASQSRISAAPQPQSRPSSEAKADTDKITELLGLAAQRTAAGRLIEPLNDNARAYVVQALQLDPENRDAMEARRSLAARLLSEARGAINQRDFTAATAWIEAANGVAVPANIEITARLLAMARNRADAPATTDITSPEAGVQRSLDAAAMIPAAQLTIVKSVQPTYPARALAAKLEGWVDLSFIVSEGGTVKDVTVQAASNPGVFDAAALKAVTQWRYQPVLREGKPTAVHTMVRIRFAQP